MERRHQAQPPRIHGAAVLGGDLASGLPVGGERVEAGGLRRRDAQHAEIVLAGQPAARRRDGAGDRDLGERVAVGKQVQAGLLQRVPVGLLGDDLAAEQAQDEVERLLHAVALGVGIDVEHHGVRRQQAGPGAEHDAAAGRANRRRLRCRQSAGTALISCGRESETSPLRPMARAAWPPTLIAPRGKQARQQWSG